MRAVWPEHLPMSVRISAHDWVEGGITPDDAIEIAKAFKAAGADMIDCSSGQVSKLQAPVYGRMYQTPFADRIRNEAGIPTIAVGAISEADHVNSIIAAGRADLCAVARPHLATPSWTGRARHSSSATWSVNGRCSSRRYRSKNNSRRQHEFPSDSSGRLAAPQGVRQRRGRQRPDALHRRHDWLGRAGPVCQRRLCDPGQAGASQYCGRASRSRRSAGEYRPDDLVPTNASTWPRRRTSARLSAKSSVPTARR